MVIWMWMWMWWTNFEFVPVTPQSLCLFYLGFLILAWEWNGDFFQICSKSLGKHLCINFHLLASFSNSSFVEFQLHIFVRHFGSSYEEVSFLFGQITHKFISGTNQTSNRQLSFSSECFIIIMFIFIQFCVVLMTRNVL
jgi:hypothetical protein